jgi:hypothetical protein
LTPATLNVVTLARPAVLSHRRDAADTEERDGQGDVVRVVIHGPAGHVDGLRAGVGDNEPVRRVGAVAAGPGGDLGDDQPAHVADARRADLTGVPVTAGFAIRFASLINNSGVIIRLRQPYKHSAAESGRR